MRTSLLAIIFALGFCVCTHSSAADDPAQEKPPPPPIRITYDVTDLVHVSQVDPDTTSVVPPTEISLTPSPQGGGRTGTRSQRRDANAADQMGALIKLIQDTVERTGWRDNGGAEGQILPFDTRIIIVAPEIVHDQVVQLLADLRKQGNRPVRITASWVALTDEELRKVIVSDTAKEGGGARIVDLAAIEKIKGAVRQHAEINAISGQRVNITAGRARSVLSAMDAVVGNASAAMQPTIDLVLAGTAFQITPVLSADGKSALLDLRAVTARWDSPDMAPMKIPVPMAATQPAASQNGAATPPAPTSEIERLNMPVHHLTTTARIPTGKAALIGGMTADMGEKDARQLYLIIQADAEK